MNFSATAIAERSKVLHVQAISVSIDPLPSEQLTDECSFLRVRAELILTFVLAAVAWTTKIRAIRREHVAAFEALGGFHFKLLRSLADRYVVQSTQIVTLCQGISDPIRVETLDWSTSCPSSEHGSILHSVCDYMQDTFCAPARIDCLLS